MRVKSIPVKSWKQDAGESGFFFFFLFVSLPSLHVCSGAPGVTIVFSEGLELSDNENDAEFDDAEPQEFHHPLEGHPDIPPVSQLQQAIAEVRSRGWRVVFFF